ncbi:MAG: hypothetical protein JOZ24_06195 [Candidatus Eremiobacteraeota bacterium]|nr:hypothetical protein [Candidatus Eremiobacteraeota bacterium]
MLFVEAVRIDHRDLVLLGDRTGSVRRAAPVGSQEKVDVVLVDELVGQPHRRRRVASVVVIGDLHPVTLPAHGDAAAVLDELDHPVAAVSDERALRGEQSSLGGFIPNVSAAEAAAK